MTTDLWQIGQYLITFDEQGATIEHQDTGDQYRVNASTATNRLHFSWHHLDVCLAIVGKHPEDLECYLVQDAPSVWKPLEGGGMDTFFRLLAELIVLAAEEIAVDLQDIPEAEIECSLGVWQVTLCGYQVFLWEDDQNGHLAAHGTVAEASQEDLVEQAAL